VVFATRLKFDGVDFLPRLDLELDLHPAVDDGGIRTDEIGLRLPLDIEPVVLLANASGHV
jgi:hypothetical protein